ncbi:VOC family protein [Novosphingobium sp. G106]|uniref:VOC family protein n=1 Tax=Novosphingobium sp. G106 TaxID=2849500 RepID=UPI001C2DAEF6|nr:VOC family protein [Novosphingobium sp. G106]MBV1686243.1 VOC family protein [Novosphingobium sp. G106]
MRWMLAAVAISMVSPASAEQATPDFTAALMSVVIRTAEPQRELTFYRDTLGMRLSMERDLGAKHEHMLSFGGDAAQPGILLVSATPASGESKVKGQGSTRIILRISNLDALAARLDRAGFVHSPIHDVGQGFRVMTASDPDQNYLELVQGNLVK